MTKKFLILMSDTGGGHRAAAEAIRDALLERQPDSIQVEIVDVLRHYSPIPWKYSPELYPLWINRGKTLWRVGYAYSNHPAQTRLMNITITWQLYFGLRRLFRNHPADVVVNVHPLMSTPALNVLNRLYRGSTRPKFVTVITDLVSTHHIWYERHADQTFVPTQAAFARGLRWGVPSEKMRVTGLPVHPRFAAALLAKPEARAKLGWDAEIPVVLLIGGGAGMGPLFEIATGIDSLGIPVQIAVVAGRNAGVRSRLEAHPWQNPAHLYGFVTNMPDLMVAADILVTKAGPATISEAFMAGLPMILSDAIPGQEDGNVQYVIDHQAGLYAPSPVKVCMAVADWLTRGPAFLDERSASARRLARPQAVWDIADSLLSL